MSAAKSPAMRKRHGFMTARRRQVLDAIIESEEVPRFATLARRVGLYDYRDARRIVRDLREMGKLS